MPGRHRRGAGARSRAAPRRRPGPVGAGDRRSRPCRAACTARVAVALARERVGVADERRDEPARGTRVQLGGRADLEDAARFHHRDPVGEAQRLLLVVGDEHRGRVRRAEDVAHLVAHPAAQRRVEVRERLVEQHDRRDPARAHARSRPAAARRPTARAAGAAPLSREADELEHLARRAPAAPAAVAHAVADVRGDREVREQRVVLEHDADAPLLGRARSARARPTSSPASSTVPASGRSKPAMRRSVVVLPQPLGPSSASNSPARTSRSRSRDRGDGTEPLGRARGTRRPRPCRGARVRWIGVDTDRRHRRSGYP